ncbi:MAG: RNA polymerase sigma factor [Bacteroidetes bacterium]|nr:RNA polymerase sigma factor [Bacteroidota bacterium]
MFSSTTTHDDAACFRLFLAGDDDAFAALFDRYNQRLYVYCHKFTGDAAKAADITQELWERVIRLRTAPQEVRNPGGFFLRIARNLCLNSMKRERRSMALDDLPDSEHPVQTQRSELEEAIEEGLSRLSFEYREVLVLNAYCGYRFEEIAAMLGKRPETIWMRASRARAQLRKEVVELVGLHHTAQHAPVPNRDSRLSEKLQ